MKKNVGNVDRVIRVILGIVLLALVVVADAPWRWVGLIGVIPLLTAFVGVCPLYSLLGIRTCPVKDS